MEIIDTIEKDLNSCFVKDDDLVVDLAADCDGNFIPKVRWITFVQFYICLPIEKNTMIF